MNKVVKRVWFFNNETDDFGMPTDYRAYVVIGRDAASGEAQAGQGIAKAYPLSQSAASLNSDHIVAEGAAGAVDEAVSRLKAMNEGLQYREEEREAP